MSISALFIIVYLMSWNHLPKQVKQIRTERSVKAPLTFSPHWKCANTWSHQTWSWKKTHNIWWTFCQESWPFSLSCYLFVFFSSSSSSATILPAPVMLVFHWSMPRCLRKGTEGEELKCKLNC